MAAVGVQNMVKTAALTAGSSATNMPVGNLQLDTGAASSAWQTVAGVRTDAAGANFRITPATRQPWRIFGLFRTNLTSGASVTWELYLNPSTLIASVGATGPVPGYGQVCAALQADVLADYCLVRLNDTANPDGFLNVPLAFAGPAWIPAYNHTWGSTLGRDSVVDELITRGGQEYPTYRYQQRRWELDFDALSDSEMWTSAEELDRLSRYGNNVMYVPDIASPRIGLETVFGRVTVTADIGYIAGFADRRTWKFRIRERL